MNKEMKIKFESYPDPSKQKLLMLRDLILTIAKDDELGDVEECLKWGEPSYISKVGSTVRIDWKAKDPEYCGIYFNCQSRLIEVFKVLYPGEFIYQGNRAILLPLNDEINLAALKDCLAKALNYHTVKHLPLLGG
jgi:hypothetical protein